jgi:Uma2 family endonuclease
VELIEGVLVFRMPKNPPHVVAVQQVLELMRQLLPVGWHYRVKSPLTLADGEPEPDGLVTRGTLRDYLDRHPGPADVALVVEVADSSLARDRGIKLRSYARAGVATYWVVNLAERFIEVYTDPRPTLAEPAYAARHDYAGADAVPVVLDGQAVGSVAVRDVLP